MIIQFFTYTFDFTCHRNQQEVSPLLEGRKKKWSRSNSKGTLHSPTGSCKGFDLNIDKWRMESLRRDSESGSEEEFFDCQGISKLYLLNSNAFNS